ncbi:hypothetical protein ASC75_13505 [Aminobacter sp. DSM 101952]|nr:hypothetical protein ASC75_13505 [Aminobacter sp. DSM 101952]
MIEDEVAQFVLASQFPKQVSRQRFRPWHIVARAMVQRGRLRPAIITSSAVTLDQFGDFLRPEFYTGADERSGPIGRRQDKGNEIEVFRS